MQANGRRGNQSMDLPAGIPRAHNLTMDELRRAYPSMPQSALRSALYRAVKRREIAIAWQGFYIILPLEYRGVGSMPPCEYIDRLMQYLKKPYCVALLNAAEMYGAAHQHPMNFTVMTSDPPPRCSQRGGCSYRICVKTQDEQRDTSGIGTKSKDTIWGDEYNHSGVHRAHPASI